MVQEIIYTSAEKGLKQGSRGFCTVISTAGMAINLAERLESMSGYRQAFPVGDPRASQNPVCYSHVTTRLAGKTLHIVSRIADAGQDYTGRSNKLAHHVAIENVSSFTGGPARVLCHPGVVVDRWSGEVKTVPPRELPSVLAPKDVTLSVWKSVTGDHGWAGAIAEQLTSSPAPLNVIFRVGMDTIGMTQEIIDLLPPAQRWNVTFSTYFTRLLAGTECQLRFVLDETPEATALRNDAKARVIDLTKPLAEPSGGSLVTMAKSGLVRLDTPAAESTNAFADLQTAARTRPATTTEESSPPSLTPTRTATPRSGNSQPLPPIPTLQPGTEARSRKGVWILIGIVILTVSATGAAIYLNRDTGPDKFGDLLARNKTTDPSKPSPELERLKREAAEREAEEKKRRAEQLTRENAEREAKAEQERLAKAKSEEEQRQKEKAERERKMAEEERLKALHEEGPFAFVKASVAAKDGKWHDEHGQWLFELPKPKAGEKARSLMLRTLSRPVTIALMDSAKAILGDEFHLALQADQNEPGVFKLVSLQDRRTIHLGTYSLTKLDTLGDPTSPDVKLDFEWAEQGPREERATELARWWPIKLTVGGEENTGVFLQRRPIEVSSTLTLGELVSGMQITAPKSADLLCFNQNTRQQMSLLLQINSMAEGKQSFDVAFSTNSPDPASPIDGEDLNTEPQNAVYFPLSDELPIRAEMPDPHMSEVGFGRIDFMATFADEGLRLGGRSRVFVKLPTQEHTANLPSIEIKNLLVRLSESRSAAEFAEILNGEPFNPDRVQPLLDSLQLAHDRYFNQLDDWYSQPLRKLPTEEKWRPRFDKLWSKTISLAQHSATAASQEQKSLDPTTERNRLKRIAFPRAMLETDKELKRLMDSYMSRYDDIQLRIDISMKKLKQTDLRVVVHLPIEADTADGHGITLTLLNISCQGVRDVSAAPEAHPPSDLIPRTNE